MTCSRRRAFALLLGLAFVPGTLSSWWWPLPQARFSGNALLEAGPLGLTGDERVIAFGDFNGDQFLDVLTLGTDQHTLAVHLWDHEDFVFKKAAQFRSMRRVLNAVPGDFTQDGRLDLLVMSQPQAKDSVGMSVYIAKPSGGFEEEEIDVPPSNGVQPVPMDANGDMKIDLLGSTGGGDLNFKIWRNIWNDSLAGEPNPHMFNVTDANFNGASCKLSNPHSNAVVDLDGDCLADLFLVCDDGNTRNQHFQIWINNGAAGYQLSQAERLPRGTQSIVFADVDRDGTIDMVFATCDSVDVKTGHGKGCSINIAYNRQLPLCNSGNSGSKSRKGGGTCRPPSALCERDPNFRFSLSERTSSNAFVRIPLADILGAPVGSAPPELLVLDTTFDPPLPVPLRLGDTSLDGFPDLLLIAIDAMGRRTPKLILNVPCDGAAVGCKADGATRGWRPARKGIDVLDTVWDARGLAFLDLDEDGTLDILVQRDGTQGAGTVFFVQNNFFYDAFFLKAIVLNGACGSGWCTTTNSSTKFHPYGVSYSGATFKYTVIDTKGRRSAAQVAQLPQTGYQSLQTPYAFFGLGRTNNYIENLFVGSTKHESYFIAMEGVVPNSKVVIIPAQDNGAWRKELYLRPGEWIPWVTLTVVIATVLLAGVVGVLHISEKRADELERKKASHHINFDAL